MSFQESSSKHGKNAGLRQVDASKSKPSHVTRTPTTPPIRSAEKTRTEQLRAKKKEIFQSEMKNLSQLKNNLEKHFTWCHEFSDDDSLSKDEKIALFELTILVNQSIGHMKLLKDAQDECNKSSPYWEDLFETIADHFEEYFESYIQYLSSLQDLQESVQSLKRNDNMVIRFNNLAWVDKENYNFDKILTYPRDRIRKLKGIIDEAKSILIDIGEGKSMTESEKSELHSCNMALSNINKILAADTSHKSENIKPTHLRRCRVLYSLRPGKDDELRLRENDIIEIISKKRNGWWQGRLHDQVGWFPGNYVKELEDCSDSDSGSTDSTEKAESSDDRSGSYREKSSSPKIGKSSSEAPLARLQRQLSSAEEARASAEARVQELILEAQKAKAEAEARAEELKKVLKSPKVEQRQARNSTSSEDSDRDSEDNNEDEDKDEDEEEDEEEDESDGQEYDVDQAELKHSIKELDEMANLAIGNVDSRQKTKKKSSANQGADDEYDDLECYFCKKVIQTYIPKEGKSYCPSCYEDVFVKKCFKCKKPVTGTGLTYKDKPWHSDCFTCTECKTPIAGEKFISKEDKPYCADCFGELFAKRCIGCTKPIIGDNGMSFISSGGRSWHNECFTCTSCKDSLIGRGFFFTKEDKIVCPGCG